MGILASRPLIEAELRRHLMLSPHVSIRHGLSVAGIHADASRAADRRRGGPAGRGRRIDLPADLVVDASGRGSQAGLARRARLRAGCRGDHRDGHRLYDAACSRGLSGESGRKVAIVGATRRAGALGCHWRRRTGAAS